MPNPLVSSLPLCLVSPQGRSLASRHQARRSDASPRWFSRLARVIAFSLSTFALLGLSTPAQAQCPNFSAPTNFATGANPFSVAVGDFNGDGQSDLAVANLASNNVSVLLGTGTGTFGAATHFAAGTTPTSVAVADFNGDGVSDLAVANSGANTVSILLGTGTGSFGAATNFGTGVSPRSVAIDDFDGDGDSDLAVANAGSHSVSILLGTGTGSFGPGTMFAVGTSPRSVATGDFDGDGDSDLAVANSGSNDVSILLGTGTGTFGASTNFAVGTSPISVAIGDFNGDGRRDLAVANSGSSNVTTLPGTGTGAFGGSTGSIKPTRTFAVGAAPAWVAVDDVNGDGRSDLVVANSGANSVSVLAGSGGGLFQPGTNFTAGAAPVSLVTADFDGDGKTDLAVANAGSNSVSILRSGLCPPVVTSIHPSTGPVTGGTVVTITGSNFVVDATTVMFGSAAATSVSCSSATQCTAMSPAGGGTVSIRATTSAGTSVDTVADDFAFTAGPTCSNFSAATNSAVGAGPRSVAIGDFNGDGVSDLAVADSGSGTGSILLGTGAGTFGARTSFDARAWAVAVGDFNDDGVSDLATAHGPNSVGVSILPGTGTGTFGAAQQTFVGLYTHAVAIGDFNGDGLSDLAVGYSSGVSILLGTGTGTFGPPVLNYVGGAGRSVAIGDFNGDGHSDLAVATLGGVSILLGTGTGTFGARTMFSAGTRFVSVAVGDFNGDGRSDLAAANAAPTGFSNKVSILLGTGTGTFGAATDFVVGPEPLSVAAGDFNGDGRSDVAVANARSSNVSILLGTGTGTFGPATNFATGGTPASVAVADFNGDGRSDLAVANQGSNTVSILLGAPGTFTLSSATESIGEEAGSVTVTVDRPAGTDCSVTIGYSTADGAAIAGADYSATSGTLTFGPGVTSQSFAVPILEDALVEGDETFTVTLSNPVGDATLGAIGAATVTIVENDTVGVTVSKTTATTSETGTSDSFTYVLNAQPTADVTLALSSGDTTEGLLGDADESGQTSVTLTFTSADWTVPQIVTVTGQDETLTDGNQIYNVSATTTSADLAWQGLAVANVAVTNADDDTPGVDVTPASGLVTTEAGGIATFDVVLNAQPSADVAITFTSSDASEALVSSDGVTQQSAVTFTFSAPNWNVAQTVSLHCQDDLITDGDQAFSITSSSVSSADGTWNGIAVGDVAATNQDDEVSAITITPASGLITNESGSSESFTIVLTSQPTADVTIDFSSSDTTEGTVAPASVTFTSANWNVPQTVTITGVDDALDDGDQAWSVVTADALSTDPTYDGAAAADVSVLNVDDDSRGITVTPVSGLATTEAGGSDSFTIVLDSEPLSDVTIDLSSSDPTEGSVAPASVTFTSANWSSPLTITVTGVDDDLADGDQAYTISAEVISADVSYDGLILPDVSMTNLDDETSSSDRDGDGVDDVIEDAGPNGGDANDDAIPDSTQPDVATFPAANGNGYITLMSTCELRNVVALHEDGFASTSIVFPFALVEFRLPCAAADMTVLYHAGNSWDPQTGYWKYGPETPGDTATTTWYQLPGVVFDTTTVAGVTVARARFPLADGVLGDNTGVDGVIVDQGGPGSNPVNNIPTASEWMLLLLASLLAAAGISRMR